MQPFPIHRLSLLAAALTLALTGASASAQSTWFVDDDGPGDIGPGNPFISDALEDGSAAHPYDRLQEAVDAASSGDTILVQPGLYFDLATIDVSSSTSTSGKALVIRGVAGPEATIIDATALNDRVMIANSSEGPDTVIEGLTLRNGDLGDDPSAHGAGLYLLGASPTVRSCIFESNHGYIGGGVLTTDSNSAFIDCTFRGNSAAWQGGGLYTSRGHVELTRCHFESNTAFVGGGGIMSRGGTAYSLRVQDSVFIGNVNQTGTGGGFHAWDATTVTLLRSRFLSNTAVVGGGLFFAGDCQARVRDCEIVGNTSTDNRGGGLTVNVATNDVKIDNVTMLDNGGYGLYVYSSGNAAVVNSILRGNSPAELAWAGTPNFVRCNVLGGVTGDNFDAPARFIDRFGPDGTIGTLDDDLRLAPDSPCIDAGHTPLVTNAYFVEYPTDLRGLPRAVDARHRMDSGTAMLGRTIDVGAHEFQDDQPFDIGAGHARGPVRTLSR